MSRQLSLQNKIIRTPNSDFPIKSRGNKPRSTLLWLWFPSYIRRRCLIRRIIICYIRYSIGMCWYSRSYLYFSQVPYSKGPISGTSETFIPRVGRPFGTEDVSSVTFENHDCSPGSKIPDSAYRIATASDDERTVGMECTGHKVCRVTSLLEDRLLCFEGG